VHHVASSTDSLVDGQERLVTYKEWADLIQASFEKCYYVPADAADDAKFDINPAMVNRRGIYKDVYGTPKDREWSDYQVSPLRVDCALLISSSDATLPCP
jgi:glycogen debranching enzyme